MQAAFFKQLSLLVDSGVYVDKALEMIAQQINHRSFRELIEDASQEVQHGSSLADALGQSGVFTPLCLQMMQAGQETGKLAEALELLSGYTSQREQFYKKMRQALLMPIITLIVFCLTAGIILVTIVPTLASFFETTGKPLPYITQLVLNVSHWMQHSYGIVPLASLVGGWLSFRFIIVRYFKAYLQKAYRHLPLIGSLIFETNLVSYLYAVALLIQGRVAVVHALALARENLALADLKTAFYGAEQKVNAGLPVHQALYETACIAPDLIGMLMIGEKSGNLGRMMMRAGDWYADRVNRRFAVINSLVQPLLMVFLALLVVGLIVAVYLPLFDLSMAVG
jgi:type IV pilus assembly protein PilC